MITGPGPETVQNPAERPQSMITAALGGPHQFTITRTGRARPAAHLTAPAPQS